MAEQEVLGFWQAYGYVALGIAVSLVLPILRAMLPAPPSPKALFVGLWPKASPYVIIGMVSLVAALLVLAVVEDPFTDWKSALLAGYMWDSTLQKLGKP